MTNKKRKGFTLVELIVVIGILATLTVTAVVAYGNVREAAYVAACKSDASTVARSLNIYNALTTNPITSLELFNDAATNLSLVITPDEGIMATDLSVSLPADRPFGAIKPYLAYNSTTKMWNIVNP